MTPKHFHTPISSRVRCPVCREAVYSRAGIHPQCAVSLSEPPRSKSKVAPLAEPEAEKVVDPTEAALVAEMPPFE
jgi:hypothetical protein